MRAVLSKIVAGSMIAGAALLASACTSNESATNVTNTTEVVPTENVTTTDTMVTNIDAAAPMDNMKSSPAPVRFERSREAMCLDWARHERRDLILQTPEHQSSLGGA